MLSRPLSIAKRLYFGILPRRFRFSKIYKNGIWSGGGCETRSGAGSTLLSTRRIRIEIPELLKQIDGRSVLDIGCGDFNWMKEISLPVDYHGIDIVESVIRDNNLKYAKRGISFSCLDAVKGPLPRGYDVIICREVLFHLSLRDITHLLRNIVMADAKYLLTTSNANVLHNHDIISGSFRNINLLQPPFNFPPPDTIIADDAVSEGRALGLWKVRDIAGQ